MLILRLSIDGFSFCMVAYYRPPGSTQLCDLFEFFEDNTDSNFVLLGDFNLPEIQWATDTLAVPPAGRAITKRFCSFVLRNDLTQHVRFPTHVKGNLFDLIFSNFSPIPTFKDADVGLFDHTALSFVFNSFYPRSRPRFLVQPG